MIHLPAPPCRCVMEAATESYWFRQTVLFDALQWRELEGIRLALVQGKTGGKVDLVVEEMDAKQAWLFSLLDLGKFMGKQVNRLLAD